MPLCASLFLAFVVAAHAEHSRSPVLTAITASSEGSLSESIGKLDAAGKTRALGRLDALDQGALGAAALSELSEAYRLLGRPEEALKSARMLAIRDGANPDGDAQTILAHAQTGNYAAAQAAAERGLKRFPGDKNLLGLLHQVKGRTVGAVSPQPAIAPQSASPLAVVPAADKRPFVLPITQGKGKPPPAPVAEAYLAPGATKASDFALNRDGLLNIFRYRTDVESPEERARMAVLKKKLDETETGRSLVSELGGWERIERDVDIRFAAVSSKNMGAYFRQFITPDSKGRRGAVVLRNELLHEPAAIAVPILAHELSHVSDFRGEHGLAIPSEFSAHRTQIQVFEEMKEKMSPAEIADLSKHPRGRYQNFIALLWEDHLVQRFKTPEEMAAAVGSVKAFAKRSREVLSDLKNGGVGPGGPQLEYHLNGKNGGLYPNLTAEKDIVDVIAERQASGSYDVEQQRKDKKILAQREALLAQAEKQDAEFRAKHGFLIKADK